MIYWQLILVYLKIGMFGFGGGYAMLSLIQYEVVDHHHWLTLQQFTDVVAISQMTPGPIGINSATYVGYAVTQSVWGAVMSVSLIAAAALLLMNKENFIDYKSILIFAAAFGVTWKWNLHPILLIILAGVAGFLLY